MIKLIHIDNINIHIVFDTFIIIDVVLDKFFLLIYISDAHFDIDALHCRNTTLPQNPPAGDDACPPQLSPKDTTSMV